ncbi:hypothetical protein AAFF_G00441010, partial [Aldrovandia affinis]
AAAPPCADDVKRHSSASFENVWLKPGEPAACERREEATAGGGAVQNGLDYMDLDLAKERTPQKGGAPDDPSTYASIRFQKEEDLRKTPAHREE